jgi:hypothetical protein
MGQSVTMTSARYWSGGREQAVDELESDRLADLGHMAAAAVCLQRVIDNFGAQGFQHPVHRRRIFGIVKAVIRVGRDDHAAVVRGDPQARQRLDHPALMASRPMSL